MRHLVDEDDVEVSRVSHGEYDGEVYHPHHRNEHSKSSEHVVRRSSVDGDGECAVARLLVAVARIVVVREEMNAMTRLLQSRRGIHHQTLGTA